MEGHSGKIKTDKKLNGFFFQLMPITRMVSEKVESEFKVFEK